MSAVTTESAGSPDAASIFAEFAAGLDFDRIPPAVVACTKKLILDQLGVMLVGASAAGVPELAASVREWGGDPVRACGALLRS